VADTAPRQSANGDAASLSVSLSRLALQTLVIVSVVAVFMLAVHLREVLAVIFLGIVVGVTCAPIADFFSRWKIPRAVSVLAIYSVLATVVVLFLWYAIPRIVDEVDSFLDDTGGFEERYEEAADEFHLPPLDELQDLLSRTGRSLAPAAAQQAMSIITGIVYAATIFVVALLYTTIKDTGHRAILSVVPPNARAGTDEVLATIARRLRRFVVGEFISMTIVGVATYIGLVALGVPFALLLAVLAFILELLPVLGPWLSAIPAILIALSESPELAIAVGVFYLVVQQIESNVLLPLVQRHQTEMPAIIVLSAVLLGGAAMGILGALVALPVAVVIHTVITEVFIPWRMRSIDQTAAT
jgi:predicted PurR-regulated permease PerM